MPIRPSQTPVEQLQRWEKRRQQVGSRIRELRLLRELTQESLALEAQLSRNMVIGIEWGRKSVAYERLWDIADVLGVDILDLFSPPTAAVIKGGLKGQFAGSSRKPRQRRLPHRNAVRSRLSAPSEP
ncbi:helix-turn-helix domain-containing protein [Arthrobacter sp. 131MFCol6.1]|uniref:helix-turn-helix domain-containing protein n=1 Tax=Arthrobacter sp. 131MFCol6.1 TaxID=1157944 RepID=UPI0009DAC28A